MSYDKISSIYTQENILLTLILKNYNSLGNRNSPMLYPDRGYIHHKYSYSVAYRISYIPDIPAVYAYIRDWSTSGITAGVQ